MTFALPAASRLTGFSLRVRDLKAALAFWRDVLGLEEATRVGDTLCLTPRGGGFTLELVHDPTAPLRPYPTVGLYHVALRLPDRKRLGAVLRRLNAARIPLEGAADHGVSEALYLRDPEGNGVELYRDKPEGTWPRPKDRRGVLMFTAPLNLEALVETAPEDAPLPPDTRFGHVHLHVPDLAEAETFYAGDLGLSVTQRNYPGALFFAAGNYHHHVGANTWAGQRRAPPHATGLIGYTCRVPPGTLARLEAHLRTRNRAFTKEGGWLRLSDPSGSIVELEEGL